MSTEQQWSQERLPRAWRVSDILSTRRNVLPFDGAWLASFGRPERTGAWLIYGNPKNGKTSLCMQLAKYCTTFGRVLYNSIEEGNSQSMEDQLRRVGMEDVERYVTVVQEPCETLMRRLEKRGSADYVFIDSLQRSGMTYEQVSDLTMKFPEKLFVYVSYAEGSRPAGAVATAMKYLVGVFVYVDKFKAFPVGRYGGGEPFVISAEMSATLWNEDL